MTKIYDTELNGLGKPARQGESPVGETYGRGVTKSRAGHEKPCLKKGGPSSKAKYSLLTDSELVP